MSRLKNLGWRDPDPNAPWTIHLRPKPASGAKTPSKESEQATKIPPKPKT
jgi:hypothetical protein